jgi:hypothetical protein
MAYMCSIRFNLIQQWGRIELLEPKCRLRTEMRSLGKFLLSSAERIEERIDFLHGVVEGYDVHGIPGFFIDRKHLPHMGDDPAFGLAAFRKTKSPVACWSVTPSPAARGEGYGLYRYDDDPRIDFRRIAGAEGVNFVHNTGFLATTDAMPADELMGLVAKAVIQDADVGKADLLERMKAALEAEDSEHLDEAAELIQKYNLVSDTTPEQIRALLRLGREM